MSENDSLFTHITGISAPIFFPKGQIITFLSSSDYAIRDYFHSLVMENDCPFFFQNHPIGKNNILFLNTDGFLFPSLSTFDNLAFSLKNRKLPKKEVEMKVDEMASFLNLNEKLGEKVSELSKIEQEKVLLGKRFILDASLYVILDTQFSKGIEKAFVSLVRKKNASVLLLTKNISFSLLVSEKVIVNFGSNHEEIGTPVSLLTSPSLLSTMRLLNQPYLNVIPIEYEGDVIHLLGKKIALKDPNYAYLAIRPDSISLAEKGTYEGSILCNEMIGERNYVHLEIWRQEIVIEDKASEKKVGEKIRFEIPLEKCLFFGKDERRVLLEKEKHFS